MSDLIRRKQPGEAWETAVDTGGGSSAGSPTYYSFAFAFDDVGLETGLTVYTPSVGDGTLFLLDAAVIVDTAFDGTTPLLDIGTGVGVTSGLFGHLANLGVFINLSTVDDESAGTGLQVGNLLATPMSLSAANGTDGSTRVVFLPFTATNPLKLWASQDGALGGTAVGGTAGAARLVFGIVTPTVL